MNELMILKACTVLISSTYYANANQFLAIAGKITLTVALRSPILIAVISQHRNPCASPVAQYSEKWVPTRKSQQQTRITGRAILDAHLLALCCANTGVFSRYIITPSMVDNKPFAYIYLLKRVILYEGL